jgi:hypothetical protein
MDSTSWTRCIRDGSDVGECCIKLIDPKIMGIQATRPFTIRRSEGLLGTGSNSLQHRTFSESNSDTGFGLYRTTCNAHVGNEWKEQLVSQLGVALRNSFAPVGGGWRSSGIQHLENRVHQKLFADLVIADLVKFTL